MRGERRITTVLPVSSLERARSFYRDKLGLEEQDTTPDGGVVMKGISGDNIELLPRPDVKPSEYTALTFEVEDVEDVVRGLESAGVRFEDYDMPTLKTERHIATMDSIKAAWFKDSEGNILCVHQVLQ